MGKLPRRVAPGVGGGKQHDLSPEIDLLRDLLHQVGALADEEDGLKEQVKVLNSVGRACAQLANLLRVQGEIGGKDTVMDEISRVAAEIRARKFKELQDPD
jgi:hypothetical protein